VVRRRVASREFQLPGATLNRAAWQGLKVKIMPLSDSSTQVLPRYWTRLRIIVLVAAVVALVAAVVRLWFYEG
jgi:hypothetical protein